MIASFTSAGVSRTIIESEVIGLVTTGAVGRRASASKASIITSWAFRAIDLLEKTTEARATIIYQVSCGSLAREAEGT